jgi:hypothetical protein
VAPAINASCLRAIPTSFAIGLDLGALAMLAIRDGRNDGDRLLVSDCVAAKITTRSQ